MVRTLALTAALLVLCLPGLGYAEKYPQFDPGKLEVRNLLLEAFQSVSPHYQKTKLLEILKIDPNNYQALVKLGELEVLREGRGNLKANEYYLRAALAQPQRPEAYLALSQSYFDMGYEPEGRDYLRKALAGGQTRLTYEAVCIEGQNFLDTANHYAAVVTYADAALSKRSPWRNDPHLLRKLYEAASLSDAPTFWVWKSSGLPAEGVGNVYWIPYVFAKLVASDTSFDDSAVHRKVLDTLRQQAEKLRQLHPKLSPRAAEKWINVILYPKVMAALRHKLGGAETVETAVRDRFKLSKQFFDFGVCDQEQVRHLTNELNLYDVFLEASVKDPKRRAELLAQLYKIRDQALEAVKGIKDPEKRGAALFKWLREHLIKDYDAVDGIPAEGVIEKHKYLCLTGAILYCLVGRDAGLKVDGFLRPNHAFAVMYNKDGERINVETTYPVKDTAEYPAGFGLADESIKPRGADLRGRAAAQGEISPLDLVSYQFTNVGLNKIDQLMFNKYRDQLVETLRDKGLDQAQIAKLIEIWRHAGGQGMKGVALMLMSLKYPEFHAEMSKAIDQALDSFSEARAFNPFNTEFLGFIESVAEDFTKLAQARPTSSMLERWRNSVQKDREALLREVQDDMRHEAESQAESQKESKKPKDADKSKPQGAGGTKQAAKEKKQAETKPVAPEEKPEIKSYDKEEGAVAEKARTDATAQEATQEWPKEKLFWLSSLKRLEKIAKSHPCSQRLKRTLLEHSLTVTGVLTVAKTINTQLDDDNKMDYEDVVDELFRIRNEFSHSEPYLTAELSRRIAQLR